jgi:hypothetical protein
MKSKKQGFYFMVFTLLMGGLIVTLSACGVSLK